MVSTSPAPTGWSVRMVRSELTRTAPLSISFCASVRDFTAREKNSHLSRRCSNQALLRLGIPQRREGGPGRIGIERDFALFTRAMLFPVRLVAVALAGKFRLARIGLVAAERLAGACCRSAGGPAGARLRRLRPRALRRPAWRRLGVSRLKRRGGRAAPSAGASPGAASARAGRRFWCRALSGRRPPGNQISSNSGSAGAAFGRYRFGSRLDGDVGGRHRVGRRGAEIGGRDVDAGGFGHRRCIGGGDALDAGSGLAVARTVSTADFGGSLGDDRRFHRRRDLRGAPHAIAERASGSRRNLRRRCRAARSSRR